MPIAVTEMRGSYDVITWGHLHVYHTKYKLNFSVCCGDVYSEGKKMHFNLFISDSSWNCKPIWPCMRKLNHKHGYILTSSCRHPVWRTAYHFRRKRKILNFTSYLLPLTFPLCSSDFLETAKCGIRSLKLAFVLT